MKTLPSFFATLMTRRSSKRNLKILSKFFIALILLVTSYTVIFHYLMALEGREYSWVSGFYWTLTVMSTLGFGDITFESDIGRIYSAIVLLSGIICLLVILPFTFIQFFYAPFMEAQAQQRAPRSLRSDISGHVILTNLGPITNALIRRLKAYNYPYVVLESDVESALRLHDHNYNVVVGECDDPETYKRLNIDKAAMLAATGTDVINSNVAFTVRELAKDLPIITMASRESAVDVLELAGSTEVVQIANLLGEFFARRANSTDTEAHVIGKFEDILIAEASVRGTDLEGKKLMETDIRNRTNLTVLGVWERGRFALVDPTSEFGHNTVLVLAGTKEQIEKYNQAHGKTGDLNAPVLIIGAGRVGRAAADSLKKKGYEIRLLDINPDRLKNYPNSVCGDASEWEVLKKAGIEVTPTVIITTNNDDTNIYLTIYCRQLRPDVMLLSRSTRERNIQTLHRAGADFVMSYASLGANIIFNFLEKNNLLIIAEGVDVFRLPVPPGLVGKTLSKSRIREDTGCSVVAVYLDGKPVINPGPDCELLKSQEMLVIGSDASEQKFLEHFS